MGHKATSHSGWWATKPCHTVRRWATRPRHTVGGATELNQGALALVPTIHCEFSMCALITDRSLTLSCLSLLRIIYTDSHEKAKVSLPPLGKISNHGSRYDTSQRKCTEPAEPNPLSKEFPLEEPLRLSPYELTKLPRLQKISLGGFP